MPNGINLSSGHTFSAHVVYDGTLLTMVLQDTVTGAQTRQSWPVNIPAIVGGNLAWVGFTGGTVTPGRVTINTWNFAEGYNPELPTPTFSVASGWYPAAQSVTINAPAGATVYYTTNGLPPTTASAQYAGPIAVAGNEVIQAIAVQSGYTDSPVASASYQVSSTSSPVINFPNGFAGAAGQVNAVGIARISGSALKLTDTAGTLETGAAWFAAPVNVQSFNTSFTIQLTSPTANGMTFTIQNQNPASSDLGSNAVSGGPFSLGYNNNGLGYQGLYSSVAVKFDLSTGTGNTTGLYQNGVAPNTAGIDLTPSGVSLHSGNPLNVQLSYNGSVLSMTITDTVTHASFTNSWTVDIPGTVGGNTAYVGFTAGTGWSTANQSVLSWTYSH